MNTIPRMAVVGLMTGEWQTARSLAVRLGAANSHLVVARLKPLVAVGLVERKTGPGYLSYWRLKAPSTQSEGTGLAQAPVDK